MLNERKLAVLIDSDNVSAKYAQFIMQEVVKYGTPTYKRVYGDWEKGGNGWHNPAINYSIMPVQQTSYIAGKNATDFSMIIDAMDILYTGSVDGFVLVTSDSDFTRLAIRLREAGKLVVGIGELKTPRAFTASCNHFCYLNQVCAPDEGMADEATIRKAVLDFVTENKDGRLDLAKIFAVLTSRFGNINFDELGYKRFSSFIDSFPELRRSNTFVTLKKKREEKPASRPLPVGGITERDIAGAIDDYFKENAPSRDNMMKIESFITSRFGMVDYSRFGSKRFAKFIDRLDGYTRNGTDVVPAAQTASEVKEIEIKPAEIKPDSTEKPTKPAEATKATSAEEKPHEKPTMSAVSELVFGYAGDNMPDGGNLGQLNNELMERFGKGYLAELGFEDMKSMLSQIKDIRVRSNHVYLTDVKYADYVMSQINSIPSEPPAPAAEEAAADIAAQEKKPMETPAEPAPAQPLPEAPKAPELPEASKQKSEENPPESAKPDITEVKSEIIEFAKSDGTGSLAVLGTKMTKKYGSGWLKALGFSSMKKLVSTIGEVTVSDNGISAKPAETEETTPDLSVIKSEIIDFAKNDETGLLAPLGARLTQKYGKGWLKALGFSSMKKLVATIDEVTVSGNNISAKSADSAPDLAAIRSEIISFAENDEAGLLSALGIKMTKKYGKDWLKALGFKSVKKLVSSIDEVEISGDNIRLKSEGKSEEARPSEEKPAEKNPEANKPAEKQPKKAAKKALDINAVKRDILEYTAKEGGIPISQLDEAMTENHGKGWHKALGSGSLKKALSGMKAVSINDDRVKISEEFAKQTEEIERFVAEYARSEGSRSIKSLSAQLKKSFEGFDFTDYGFAKFTDFLNAIDGVKADRYRVEPLD